MTSRKYVGENDYGNLVAREKKTMRENPGPPGRGLGRQLSVHSCKITWLQKREQDIQPFQGLEELRAQQNYGGAGLR